MSATDLYQLIISKWQASLRYELLAGLRAAPQGAATGTEGWMMIWAFLKKQESEDPTAYAEIAEIVCQLKQWFRSEGIHLS